MPRLAVALCSIVLVIVLSTTLSESKSLFRKKRQMADLKTAELSALISLGGNYAPRGCRSVGCGIVDIIKRKRNADIGNSQLLAERLTNDCNFGVGCGVEDISERKRSADNGISQLLAERLTNDCNFGVGCGVEDIFRRVRRSGADQRIAELQALIALTNHGGMVAHGQFDPLRIGKRSGNNEYLGDLSLEERFQLMRNILRRAAERNA